MGSFVLHLPIFYLLGFWWRWLSIISELDVLLTTRCQLEWSFQIMLHLGPSDPSGLEKCAKHGDASCFWGENFLSPSCEIIRTTENHLFLSCEMIRTTDQQLLLRWCAAWQADWRWWGASTPLLSSTSKLSPLRFFSVLSSAVREMDGVQHSKMSSFIDSFKTIPIDPLGDWRHLKGSTPRFGRRRIRNGLQGVRSSSLVPPDLRQPWTWRDDYQRWILFNFSAFMLGCLARASVQRAGMDFISQAQKWAFLTPSSPDNWWEGWEVSTSRLDQLTKETAVAHPRLMVKFLSEYVLCWIMGSHKASSSFLASSTTSPPTAGTNSQRPKHNHSTLSTSMG